MLDVPAAIGLPRSLAANTDKTNIKKVDRFEKEKIAFFRVFLKIKNALLSYLMTQTFEEVEAL